MKNFVCFITLIIMVLIILCSCSYEDPEIKYITDNIFLATHLGEVALFEDNSIYGKDGSEICMGDDVIIIQKNFEAYTLFSETLILCEENNDLQFFWTYNLRTKELDSYSNYSELCEQLSCREFEWEKLWVPEFSIK